MINGKKFVSVERAHGGHEITAMCLNDTQRILFTGAINGSVTAWNVANGQAIQIFEPLNDCEITGLVFVDKKRILLSVGSSRKIVVYSDVTFDVFEACF